MNLKKLFLLSFVGITFLFGKSISEIERGYFPSVKEVKGLVSHYDPQTKTFLPVRVGMPLTKSTILVTGPESELIFSCKGKIAGCLLENSRVILHPAFNQEYRADLKFGTITISLDPDRPIGKPTFSVQTLSGITQAKGTLFAVTEYKGQTYTAVKKGEIKKETKPPSMPDFSAYLNPAKKPKPSPEKSAKSE